MSNFSPEVILDTKLYYSPSELLQILQNYSIEDRIAYFYTCLIDLLYLTVYSALLWILAGKKGFAFLPGFFDFIETGSILLYILGKVEFTHIQHLGVISFLKWIFVIFVTAFIVRKFYLSRRDII